MKLSIKDRLTIPSFLPEKGGYIEQIHVRSIRNKIDLTPKEIEEYDVKDDGDYVVWDVEIAQCLEIDFTQGEINVLGMVIDRMDKAKEITQDNLELCEEIKSQIK